MRLIDADKVIVTRYDYEKPLTLKERLYRLLDNQPTVNAIPVEWIKQQLEKEEYRTFLVDYIEWGGCLRWLLEAWEEENEINRC